MKDYSFQVAGGSIVGRDHVGRNGLLLGKNNQDSFAFRTYGNFTAAVVCDGCGSSPHSEVGSKIAARLILSALERRLTRRGGLLHPADSATLWEGVRRDVLAEIRVLAREIAGTESITEAISDYFLFTSLILLITPDFTEVVGIGDGVFALNGEITEIAPDAGNKPLYLAYDLIESDFSSEPERLRFKLHRRIATSELHSALIGTDGVTHWITNSARTLPGRDEPIGALEQFWTQEKFMKNADAVRRRLTIANSEVMVLGRDRRNFQTETGPLADDTTIVVACRTKP